MNDAAVVHSRASGANPTPFRIQTDVGAEAPAASLGPEKRPPGRRVRPPKPASVADADGAEIVPVDVSAFGFAAVPTWLVAEHRSRSARAMHAALKLAGFWCAAPLALLIPPHVEPTLIVLGAGVYYAHKHWRGEYIVHRFEGECPRCGAALTIKPRTPVRFPEGVTCYACHSDAVVVPAAGQA